MNWPRDTQTQLAAQNFPLRIQAQQPAPQASGNTRFHPNSWIRYLRQGDQFPAGAARTYTAPSLIIEEFRAGHYLPALALTVAWGTMARTTPLVYRWPLQDIHDTLTQCAQSITTTQSIQGAWQLLVENLGWTSVMSSKTLHFLCRALGHTLYPPVPIDLEVIRKKVWPKFQQNIPHAHCPGNGNGDSFTAYCRYMTAIIEWADVRGWSTTEMEATIWDEYN